MISIRSSILVAINALGFGISVLITGPLVLGIGSAGFVASPRGCLKEDPGIGSRSKSRTLLWQTRQENSTLHGVARVAPCRQRPHKRCPGVKVLIIISSWSTELPKVRTTGGFRRCGVGKVSLAFLAAHPVLSGQGAIDSWPCNFRSYIHGLL